MTRGEFLRNISILTGGATLAPSMMLELHQAAQKTGSKAIGDYFAVDNEGNISFTGASDAMFTPIELHNYLSDLWSKDGFNLDEEI